MNVLSILTYYYPHWTGLTYHAQLLAEALAERGHRVTVLTSRHEAHLPTRERRRGVDVIRLPILTYVSRGVIMPSIVHRLVPLLMENDVIHIHSPLPEAAYVAALSKIMGKRVVITHHGDVVMPPGRRNRAIQRLMHADFSIAARMADRIVAYSDDYARSSACVSMFLDKTTSIYPPVSIPTPLPDNVARLRKQSGLDGHVVIGTSGRFVEEKGYDVLLRAIPDILAAVPRAKIVFTGEYRSITYEKFYERNLPLIERHRSHIQFMGLIRDRQMLADFYAMCDVLAHPSRSECFALAQVEAMLCGTPVVASDVPGGRVPVQVTGMGRVFPSESSAELAARLVHVIGARSSFVRPRQRIERLFDRQRTVDQNEALFVSLLKKGSGHGTERRPRSI